MNIESIFNRLWNDYTDKNPSAKKIYELFTSEGETVINDHIAFRTFNDSKIDIDVLAKPFISRGYEEKGSYFFEEKHIYAKHYELKNNPSAPKIFISELITEDFSPFLQKQVSQLINQIPIGVANSDEIIFTELLWDTPSFEIYEQLRKESEYAAWIYVYGFRANHFTVLINALKKYNTIEKVNEFLKQNNFKLNSSGGEIKGNRNEFLQQSSTLAEIVKIKFKEGEFEIPSCYYEFAIRYAQSNGKIFNGFIAKSADKIFESTNFYKQ